MSKKRQDHLVCADKNNQDSKFCPPKNPSLSPSPQPPPPKYQMVVPLRCFCWLTIPGKL